MEFVKVLFDEFSKKSMKDGETFHAWLKVSKSFLRRPQGNVFLRVSAAGKQVFIIRI